MDENHAHIVNTFRRLGCSVLSLAGLGQGVPDLLIANRHGSYLVEVKNPGKPPSKRVLTPDQIEFHAQWRGKVYIVETTQDVAEVVIKAAREAEAVF